MEYELVDQHIERMVQRPAFPRHDSPETTTDFDLFFGKKGKFLQF